MLVIASFEVCGRAVEKHSNGFWHAICIQDEGLAKSANIILKEPSLMNRTDHLVEHLIRQWISLEENHSEQNMATDEEEDIAEIVFLPTGYELRGLRLAS